MKGISFLRFTYFLSYEYLPACVYVHDIHAVPLETEKRVSDPMKLKLRVVVSGHGGAEN